MRGLVERVAKLEARIQPVRRHVQPMSSESAASILERVRNRMRYESLAMKVITPAQHLASLNRQRAVLVRERAKEMSPERRMPTVAVFGDGLEECEAHIAKLSAELVTQ